MIKDKLKSATNPIVWTDAAKQLVDDHIEVMVVEGHVRSLPIQQNDANNAMGDLSYILKKYSIGLDYLWIIMRLNNFEHVNSITMATTSILVPNMEYLNRLLASLSTKK